MRTTIISTGDELLAGAVTDTNARWMAARFSEIGFEVGRMETVGDDIDRIAAVLRRGFSDSDLLVVSGGLGPTDDDVTARAAALAIDAPITRNAEAEDVIRAAFERLNRNPDPVNLRQADLPRDCRVLRNRLGSAAGFVIDSGSCVAYFLPGVPSELRGMFDEHVAPALPRLAGGVPPLVFRCFGAGESDLQSILNSLLSKYPVLKASFLVIHPEVNITLTGFGEDLRHDIREEASALLGRAVFAEEAVDLPTALGRELAAAGLTIGCAESCTGGLIGHSITRVAGSSAWFRGGVVAYSNDLKTSLLGVPRSLIDRHGAVSEETARAMAAGARERLGCDLALATSGIAGPGGGGTGKPVGLVHAALAHPRGTEHASRVFAGYDRSGVKRAAAWTVMLLALRWTAGTEPGGFEER